MVARINNSWTELCSEENREVGEKDNKGGNKSMTG